MPEEPADLVEETFRELLNIAIARGQRPRCTAILGPATWAAIDALAREHPDATPDHFVNVYDAFAIEHRHTDSAGLRSCGDPLTAKATEFAAIDALVAQLRISYPDVAPATVAAVVRHIHADFDEHAVRDFILLFVEQAAHQRLA